MRFLSCHKDDVVKHYGGRADLRDARGGTSDLSEYFSLGRPARKFQAISAPLIACIVLSNNEAPQPDRPAERDGDGADLSGACEAKGP